MALEGLWHDYRRFSDLFCPPGVQGTAEGGSLSKRPATECSP